MFNLQKAAVFEYCGIIHVHSTYSDGSGSIPTILTAAQQNQLDFLILTDHNSLGARVDGWEGRHGDVLLIVGDEVSTRRGHCLALGTQQRVNHRQPLQEMVADINRQKNALSFIAHPHGQYHPLFKTRDHSWRTWDVDNVTGLELWSYMFDWIQGFRYYRFWRHYWHPERHITGPHAQTLKAWDRICQKQQCVAIGGVDAHARQYPFLPFEVFPYKDAFGTLRTRVFLHQPLSGDAQNDISVILHALQKGHCLISYDFLQDGKGTRFHSVDHQIQMGDEVQFQKPVDLEIHLPINTDFNIICDGQCVLKHHAQHHVFQAERPGVYRMEAHIENAPWIYTNPIYLRAGAVSS